MPIPDVESSLNLNPSCQFVAIFVVDSCSFSESVALLIVRRMFAAAVFVRGVDIRALDVGRIMRRCR